ncbi:MAG: winged helix-turn-helix domain-containing protein [Desulfurococcaceae archaeon]
MNNNIENDERVLKIISVLADNPGISLRELSRKTGLNYSYVRRKIISMFSKHMIANGLMISSNLVGKEGAIVKINGNVSNDILDNLSTCNKVLAIFRLNHGEIRLLIHGRDKREIIEFVEALKSITSDLNEIMVEYGVLLDKTMIPLKQGRIKCNIPSECKECLSSRITRFHGKTISLD